MFTRLVIIAILAVLFGLAWHDQPSGKTQRNKRD